jgi:hypothetical protein
VASHQHAAHSDHAALSHSGATVGNHADVLNHKHPLATGTGASGNFNQVIGTQDASSGGTGGTPTQAALGTLSGDPSANGVAAQVHSVGQASQHAAQAHSAHDSLDNRPPFYALAYIQKT